MGGYFGLLEETQYWWILTRATNIGANNQENKINFIEFKDAICWKSSPNSLKKNRLLQ